MTKRPPGSGTKTEISPGRWYLRWRDNGRRLGKVFGGTEAEADALLDAIAAEIAERGSLGGAVTVAQLCARWLDYEERRGRRGIRAQRSRYRVHVETAPFAHWPADDLTPGELRRFLDRLERRLAATTVRHVAYLLSAAYRYGLERELVLANPVAHVRKPKGRRSRRDRVLDEGQLEQLVEFDGSVDPELECIAQVLVGTSLRPGELLGLTDIVLDGDEPHLQVTRSGRRTDETKTRVDRRVELFGLGLDACRRWVEALRPRLVVRGHQRVQCERWVFPVPQSWLRADGRLGAVLAAVGATGLTAHDLRGTGATHLLSGTELLCGPAGEPWTIAEVAAHIGDSIQTTERSYAHLTGTAARRAARGTRLGHERHGRTNESPTFYGVGHEGLEPSANGLRGLTVVEGSRVPGCWDIPSVSHAERIVARVAAGEVVPWAEMFAALVELLGREKSGLTSPNLMLDKVT